MAYRIALGVSGSIAAYKTPELVRRLRKASFSVTPILTEKAQHFVAPLALSTVAETPAYLSSNYFDPSIPHLSLERDHDLLLVAPATANCIAKFALGLSDDLLSSHFMSFTGTKIVCPAMHDEMFRSPAVQRNIDTLRHDGVIILGPESGDLACGDVGRGRLIELDLIVAATKAYQLGHLDLTGRKILLSSGGTQESIDPVRVITNKSSGKLGRCLTDMASVFGAELKVVSSIAPSYANPAVLAYDHVESAADMADALAAHLDWADTLIMAAAVSDFTTAASPKKIRRSGGLALDLTPTADILKTLHDKKGDRTFIGFCLADDDLETRAREKLEAKGLDFIVGNTSRNFGADERDAKILSATSNKVETLSGASLDALSFSILKRLV